MKPKSYEYFAHSEQTLTLFRAVVSFATAWITDKDLYTRIDAFTQAHNATKSSGLEYFFPRTPSVHSFISFYFSQENHEGHLLGSLVEAAFELMEDKFILSKNGMPTQAGGVSNQSYVLNDEWITYLRDNDLLYNDLFGFRYVIERYQHSVVKIEVHSIDGRISIGTGWLLDIILPAPAERIRVVVTNAHVIDGSKSFKVLDKDDVVIPHYNQESFQKREQVDMALILIDRQEQVPDFCMAHTTGLLAEVITIGYPAIPLSRAAYQVVHRGEVNASVKDYLTNQDLLIISARTAPGNSGSPVLDEMGRVVGMLVQELFEKEDFQERGIAPYSACLPAATINDMLNKSTLIRPSLADAILPEGEA
jgi:S1-C subfamily serine protease